MARARDANIRALADSGCAPVRVKTIEIRTGIWPARGAGAVKKRAATGAGNLCAAGASGPAPAKDRPCC